MEETFWLASIYVALYAMCKGLQTALVIGWQGWQCGPAWREANLKTSTPQQGEIDEAN
jgi:hypothetical protein